jgi:hypothetical protein
MLKKLHKERPAAIPIYQNTIQIQVKKGSIVLLEKREKKAISS